MTIDKEMALDYAWKWFEYHATQRLLAFRFFLVFLGIMIVGYNSAIDSGNLLLASSLAYSGALVSLAFLMLEIRNERLVEVGRVALEKAEGLAFPENDELKVLKEGKPRGQIYSHKFWLRVIYIACLAAFLLSGIRPDIFAV